MLPEILGQEQFSTLGKGVEFEVPKDVVTSDYFEGIAQLRIVNQIVIDDRARNPELGA